MLGRQQRIECFLGKQAIEGRGGKAENRQAKASGWLHLSDEAKCAAGYTQCPAQDGEEDKPDEDVAEVVEANGCERQREADP